MSWNDRDKLKEDVWQYCDCWIRWIEDDRVVWKYGLYDAFDKDTLCQVRDALSDLDSTSAGETVQVLLEQLEEFSDGFDEFNEMRIQDSYDYHDTMHSISTNRSYLLDVRRLLRLLAK